MPSSHTVGHLVLDHFTLRTRLAVPLELLVDVTSLTLGATLFAIAFLVGKLQEAEAYAE